MEIDWHEIIWDGRRMALEMLWNAVVVNISAYWWFGPLVLAIVVSAGWKKIGRFGAYVARVLGHTNGSG